MSAPRLIFADCDPRNRTCKKCGRAFTVEYPSSRKLYCSRQCANSDHPKAIGERNPNWRGGKTSHPLRRVYVEMIARCHRPTHRRYADYGGRGITVCQRWREDFWSFVADMGTRPEGLTLERIDNDKGVFAGELPVGNLSRTGAESASQAFPQSNARGPESMNTKIFFIDTETVSLIAGPATIWELALIERNPAFTGDEEYLWQIRPDLAKADPGALKIGGYYERCQVRGYAPGNFRKFPLCEEDEPEYGDSRYLAQVIAPMLDGAYLVAANPWFDAKHMAALLRANGECLTADYHLTDLGSLVRGWAAAQGMRLPFPLKVADAARVVGIDPGSYDAHAALGDARMGRDIYDAVMAGGAS